MNLITHKAVKMYLEKENPTQSEKESVIRMLDSAIRCNTEILKQIELQLRKESEQSTEVE